jgi:hypothetical protein
MQISLSTHDTITPDLLARYRASTDKASIHTALAMQLQSMTKRAFTDTALRPAAWPNKTNGGAATLRKSGTLAKSIRAIGTATAATMTAFTPPSTSSVVRPPRTSSARETNRHSKPPSASLPKSTTPAARSPRAPTCHSSVMVAPPASPCRPLTKCSAPSSACPNDPTKYTT